MDSNPKPKQPKKRGLSMLTTPAPKKSKSENIYDDSHKLLQNATSPLYKQETNLREILQHPLAVSTISNQVHAIGVEDFASAAATFKENGRAGRHDEEWLQQAEAAKKMRQSGEFDEYHQFLFNKHWAEGSSELADNGGSGSSSYGCRGVTEEKPHHDDDAGAGGSGDRMTSSRFSHSSATGGAEYNQNKGFGQDTQYGQNSKYTQNSGNGYDSSDGKAPGYYSSHSFPDYSHTLENTQTTDHMLISSHVRSPTSAQETSYYQEQINGHRTDFFPNSSNAQYTGYGNLQVQTPTHFSSRLGFLPDYLTGLYIGAGNRPAYYSAGEIDTLRSSPDYIPGWHYDPKFPVDPALKHILPLRPCNITNAKGKPELIETWLVYGVVVLGPFDAQKFLYGIPSRTVPTSSELKTTDNQLAAQNGEAASTSS